VGSIAPGLGSAGGRGPVLPTPSGGSSTGALGSRAASRDRERDRAVGARPRTPPRVSGASVDRPPTAGAYRAPSNVAGGARSGDNGLAQLANSGRSDGGGPPLPGAPGGANRPGSSGSRGPSAERSGVRSAERGGSAGKAGPKSFEEKFQEQRAAFAKDKAKQRGLSPGGVPLPSALQQARATAQANARRQEAAQAVAQAVAQAAAQAAATASTEGAVAVAWRHVLGFLQASPEAALSLEALFDAGGTLDLAKVSHALTRLGAKLTERQLLAFQRDADVNGDGQVRVVWLFVLAIKRRACFLELQNVYIYIYLCADLS
jgi:hypothetical protein